MRNIKGFSRISQENKYKNGISIFGHIYILYSTIVIRLIK